MVGIDVGWSYNTLSQYGTLYAHNLETEREMHPSIEWIGPRRTKQKATYEKKLEKLHMQPP